MKAPPGRSGRRARRRTCPGAGRPAGRHSPRGFRPSPQGQGHGEDRQTHSGRRPVVCRPADGSLLQWFELALFPARCQVLGFGTGGGSLVAWTADRKPAWRCAPSQNGLLAEAPQRQSEIISRPERSNGLPRASWITNLPAIRSGPLSRQMIVTSLIRNHTPYECDDSQPLPCLSGRLPDKRGPGIGKRSYHRPILP